MMLNLGSARGTTLGKFLSKMSMCLSGSVTVICSMYNETFEKAVESFDARRDLGQLFRANVDDSMTNTAYIGADSIINFSLCQSFRDKICSKSAIQNPTSVSKSFISTATLDRKPSSQWSFLEQFLQLPVLLFLAWKEINFCLIGLLGV